MTIAQKSLQATRVIYVALLFAAIAYLAIPLLVAPTHSREPSLVFVLALGVVALSTLGVAAFYRSRMVQPANEALSRNPDDDSAAARWRQGVIVSLVCCDSIVLFGLALRFVGVAWSKCSIFYAVGIFFMLAWRPRLELPPT